MAEKTLLGDECVPVILPWLDRPGLLHIPSMTVIPPLSGGDDGDEDDKADDDKAKNDKDDEKSDDDEGAKSDDDEDDDDKIKSDDDWRVKARKTERELKATRKREADLAAKLKQRDDADKSDAQKAIDAARDEATATVTTKYEAERRTDRIENAVTKLSLKGLKGKDDAGKDITLKFADPDDAQLRIDRALRNGDLAYDDIYADGKVLTDAVTEFLVELLEEHPRLRAAPSTQQQRVDFDAGKGSGSGSNKDLEDMTPEDHAKRKGRQGT